MDELEKELREEEARLQINYVKAMADMMQSIPTFARDADEDDWRVLDSGKRMYTEQDITDMQKRALEMYYKYPSARGIIDTMINFVVGKDAHVVPETETDKVKAYWKKFTDDNKFDIRFKELVRRCFRDGEMFLRFYPHKKSNPNKVPLVRFIEPDRISDPTGKHTFGIQVNRNDVEDVIAYHVTNPSNNNVTILPAKEVIHTKINVDSNVKRGISFFTGIAKYIVKYGGWLDDRIMLNKIRSMFAMVMKVTGISPSTFTDKFADNTRTQAGSTAEKRMPKPGSVLVATPGLDYDFKSLNLHAMDTGKDGRLIELQSAKGTGLTEYVIRGDSSNSNYSSTMVSESPMVRMFESWQDIFEKPYKEIYKKVIEYGIKVRELDKGTSVECSVNFAGLIHRDTEKETNAFVAQIAAKIVSKRTVREKFGYDHDQEEARIRQEEDEDAANEYRVTPGQESDNAPKDPPKRSGPNNRQPRPSE